MLATSDSQTPVFIEQKPDWGQNVNFDITFNTIVTRNRIGGEQRGNRRSRPAYGLDYQQSNLDIENYAAEKARTLKALGAPLVVPIWPRWFTLLEMSTVNRALFTASIARKPFKPGQYAYFVQDGLVSTFRLITAVGDTTIDFDASAAYPGPSIPAFTSGASVYPCIFGSNKDNAAGFKLARVNASNRIVSVEEL